MTEIRVYFECLEQASHYILPLIEQGIKESGTTHDIKVKLVLRPRALRKSGANALSAIYALTIPDFLVTFCSEEKEIPIIVGEFSEAVQTEDHELQRAIGAIASALTGAFYLKISGEKKTLREHGGKEGFSSLTVAKILREVFGYQGFIPAIWSTAKNNTCILRRDLNFPSCPAPGVIPIVEEVVPAIIGETAKHHQLISQNKNSVTDIVYPALKKLNTFCFLESQISTASGLQEMVSDWKSRRSSRIQYSDSLTIKINRFSHAADPERGMLIFASSLLPAKSVFTKYEVNQAVSDDLDLLYAFVTQAQSEGIPKRFLEPLTEIILSHNSLKQIDLTKFLCKLKQIWSQNKVLFSLFMFSDKMTIFSGSINIDLVWDRKCIYNIYKDNLTNSLASELGARVISAPLKLKPHHSLTEDEVTYILVHRILKPNNFTIISVSYPGAQGDAAILPEKGTGRAQRRMYLDVIAWLPSSVHQDIALEESKDTFNKESIENTIRRLSEFKTDNSKRNALIDTIQRISGSGTLRKIYIGVAFGVGGHIITSWKPSNVDFIVRIIDRSTWDVGYFGSALKSAFQIMEGQINLPTVYEIIEEQQNPTLFNDIEGDL